MHDAFIETASLVKEHGPLRVLDGVDFAVRRGEVAALIGPSGGGKSTLLRCLNGLEPFQAGTVRVDQLTLNAMDRRSAMMSELQMLRRTVGMVFQQFNLFPHLNVLNNVTLAPRKALGWDRARAEDTARKLLDRVGLADKLTARPDQLSGGQQQRVAIARALAMQPQAILFDEPTSALDPRMAGEVLGVITDLARDGLTMVVVTHAMHFARQVANVVCVMHAGKVAESGPPVQVFGDPVTEVTRQFLREVVRGSPG